LLALAFALKHGIGLVPMGVGLLAFVGTLIAASWLATIYLWRPLPIVAPLLFGWIYYLTAAVRAYLRERSERRRVTELFGRFLDPRVVAELVAQGDTATMLLGQKREVTVLFSDICSFTTLSEKQPPQAIVDLLNRYFARQVEVIYRHQGTLDKYMGDGMMAFWGAPTDQPEHALQAVAAARDMVRALEEFRRELGRAGTSFDIGIGIHTGEAVVGFIGSPEHRQDYTVIGDAVNTASRIEGKTRGRCRVLVSEATRRACGEAVSFRDRGRAKLKGRTQQVRLYEPLWS
jgi:adenylate cyclase